MKRDSHREGVYGSLSLQGGGEALESLSKPRLLFEYFRMNFRNPIVRKSSIKVICQTDTASLRRPHPVVESLVGVYRGGQLPTRGYSAV